MSATRLRTTIAAALAVAAMTSLSACGSSTTAGSAAVVGNQEVPDVAVAQLTDELQRQLQSVKGFTYDPAKGTSETVLRLTTSLLLHEAAKREGIVVTPSQVDQVLTANSAGTGGRAALDTALAQRSSVPASAVDSFAEDFLIGQALRQKIAPSSADQGAKALNDYLGKLSAELGTKIAPRYGTWDPKNSTIGPVPGDLASGLTATG